MSLGKAITLKTGCLMACGALAIFAFGPTASATVVRINFSGSFTNASTSTPFAGYANLQIGTDSLASSSFPSPTLPPAAASSTGVPPAGTASLAPGTPRVDPANAQAITGATGMFNGHAIVGVMQIGAQTDPDLNEYIPASRTDLSTGGAPVSYDNLFYADGSPLTCLWYYPSGETAPKYPFSGGFLDIYGVLFVLDNGTVVDLWSNGVMPGLGLNYGATLLASANGNYTVLSSQFNGVTATVPEPDFLWLFGAALLGLFAWRRTVESRKVRRAA